MNKVRVITDSNSGMLQAEAEALGVTLVPMPFFVDGEEFFEEISLSQEQFYQLLKRDADVKTAQPSPYYLEELWGGILKEYDEIVYIPMCSGLSGTCEMAKGIAEKYDGKVQVVDNKRISITQKESVMEAVAMVKAGKTAAEIKDYLEETGKISSIYIMVDDLKYLKKGGRIKPAAAALGTMLNIKPVLFTRGDKFDKFAMPFSVKQAKKRMLDKIADELNTEFKEYYESGRMVASVAHTQNFQNAEDFKNEIIAAFPKIVFHYVDQLSLSVSCHIGPGSLAIALAVNNYLDK
ncbi:MAG: DegV family protein [Corallococcus sp.]|nr:DegV family protein [Corallococcus sp.]